MIPSIQTHSGTMVDLVNPDPDTINIYDIAHALSYICRFTGHLNEFYSVAQHSVMVADLLPENLKLTGLLHDAAEAYTGDMSSPLKSVCHDYRVIQKNFEKVIAKKYRTINPLPQLVKDADVQALATETQLFSVYPNWVKNYANPLDVQIVPWTPDRAKELFLEKFTELSAL